jgi:hypothetical protein
MEPLPARSKRENISVRRLMSAAILVAVLASTYGTVAAYAAVRVSISWKFATGRIEAGGSPTATFNVHFPRGDRAVLEKQVGGAHKWVGVAALHLRHGGNGSIEAPPDQQGAYRYRIAVLHGHHTVAVSKVLTIYAYGNVALATIVGHGTNVVSVNGQPFTYAVGIFATETSGGVDSTPQIDTLVSMSHTTCRSISLRLAAPTPNAGESGGTVSASVTQENADATTVNLTGNQIAPLSAALTGAAWQLNASSLTPDNGPAGPHNLDIAANGSLSCYTPSGR